MCVEKIFNVMRGANLFVFWVLFLVWLAFWHLFDSGLVHFLCC